MIFYIRVKNIINIFDIVSFVYPMYPVLFDIADLYHDIDLKKKCIRYRGTCIKKVGTSEIVELDNGTHAPQYLEECFEVIDRDLKGLIKKQNHLIDDR